MKRLLMLLAFALVCAACEKEKQEEEPLVAIQKIPASYWEMQRVIGEQTKTYWHFTEDGKLIEYIELFYRVDSLGGFPVVRYDCPCSYDPTERIMRLTYDVFPYAEMVPLANNFRLDQGDQSYEVVQFTEDELRLRKIGLKFTFNYKRFEPDADLLESFARSMTDEELYRRWYGDNYLDSLLHYNH